MLSKDIFVPLTICIDQTRRALVIALPCYGALEIVGVIIIIIIPISAHWRLIFNVVRCVLLTYLLNSTQTFKESRLWLTAA